MSLCLWYLCHPKHFYCYCWCLGEEKSNSEWQEGFPMPDNKVIHLCVLLLLIWFQLIFKNLTHLEFTINMLWRINPNLSHDSCPNTTYVQIHLFITDLRYYLYHIVKFHTQLCLFLDSSLLFPWSNCLFMQHQLSIQYLISEKVISSRNSNVLYRVVQTTLIWFFKSPVLILIFPPDISNSV